MSWSTLPTPNHQSPIQQLSVPPLISPSYKPVIAIGMPYTTDITMMFGVKTLGPLLYIPHPLFDKIPKMVRGVPTGVARDQIVELALADPHITHIMWIDTDSICAQPNDPNVAIQLLLSCNEPIVSGLYRAKQAVGFNYAMWAAAQEPGGKKGFVPINDFTGNWLQVDTVGFGFCLTRMDVFRKLPKPWFPWNTPSPSEDFAFCIAARQHGYKINVFTDVKIDHIGDLIVHHDGKITTLDV